MGACILDRNKAAREWVIGETLTLTPTLTPTRVRVTVRVRVRVSLYHKEIKLCSPFVSLLVRVRVRVRIRDRVGFGVRIRVRVRVRVRVSRGGGLFSTHTCMQGRVVRHAV